MSAPVGLNRVAGPAGMFARLTVRLLHSRPGHVQIEVRPGDFAACCIPFEEAVSLVSEGFCPCHVAHEPGTARLAADGRCEPCGGCTWGVVSDFG